MAEKFAVRTADDIETLRAENKVESVSGARERDNFSVLIEIRRVGYFPSY